MAIKLSSAFRPATRTALLVPLAGAAPRRTPPYPVLAAAAPRFAGGGRVRLAEARVLLPLTSKRSSSPGDGGGVLCLAQRADDGSAGAGGEEKVMGSGGGGKDKEVPGSGGKDKEVPGSGGSELLAGFGGDEVDAKKDWSFTDGKGDRADGGDGKVGSGGGKRMEVAGSSGKDGVWRERRKRPLFYLRGSRSSRLQRKPPSRLKLCLRRMKRICLAIGWTFFQSIVSFLVFAMCGFILYKYNHLDELIKAQVKSVLEDTNVHRQMANAFVGIFYAWWKINYIRGGTIVTFISYSVLLWIKKGA